MVRRKIEIKPLENKAKRHTTFTKRRDGLQKKTVEFCKLSDSSAIVITFSHSGNCYALGHPHVNVVLERYEEAETSAVGERLHEPEAETSAVGERLHGTEEEEEEEEQPLTKVEERIRQGIITGCWDEAARGLGLKQLDEMMTKMDELRREIAPAPASAGDSC